MSAAKAKRIPMTSILQSVDGKRARARVGAFAPMMCGGVNSGKSAAEAIPGALYAIPDDRPQTMRRLSFRFLITSQPNQGDRP